MHRPNRVSRLSVESIRRFGVSTTSLPVDAGCGSRAGGHGWLQGEGGLFVDVRACGAQGPCTGLMRLPLAAPACRRRCRPSTFSAWRSASCLRSAAASSSALRSCASTSSLSPAPLSDPSALTIVTAPLFNDRPLLPQRPLHAGLVGLKTCMLSRRARHKETIRPNRVLLQHQ